MKLTPEIAPSILSFPYFELNSAVIQLQSAEVEWIHLDVMDGQFVPQITFGAALSKEIGQVSGTARLEAHLMTQSPENHFDAFIEAGCERITFHTEATDHGYRLCQYLKKSSVLAGVAINPGTPVESLYPYLEIMDLALIMTVNPGWGGQSLIEECLKKVTAIRALSPTLAIQVDGGIDDQNIRRVYEAGANVFVTGSYLTRTPSISEGVKRLRAACLS